MNTPIIITAFGTTSKAQVTYARLDRQIRNCFPENEILWSFSSRVITSKKSADLKQRYPDPEEVLQRLYEQGCKQAVLQSAHLWPGHEFHKILRITHSSPVRLSIGLPLLSSVADYEKIAACLDPIVLKHPGKAVIIAGHGTSHPAWTGYFALEHFLQKRFGKSVFLALLKGYPSPEEMVQRVQDAGYDSACLVPFMLLAGRHFEQELTGPDPASWKSQLEKAAISVSVIEHGLGMLEGVGQIFCDHIREALENCTTLSPE